MELLFAILGLLPVVLSFVTDKNVPVVHTTTGVVRGKTVRRLDVDVDEYFGIPYALPPVGDLRFRRPVPISPWSGVYDAITKPPTCQQLVFRTNYYLPNPENMTEDCLYLNLWVPRQQESSEPKSVMVFIHGGAFFTGSSNMDVLDGGILAAYGDVIVASFNYRVGALGFFSAGIEGANGNMGMYDQLLAIKWVKENAERFGGNKDTITLFGQSAGAQSLALHLISPLSQNLFKRAILQSGSALYPITSRFPEILLKSSGFIARMAGCASTELTVESDPEKVVECMRSIPAENVSGNAVSPFFPAYGDEFLPKDIPKLFSKRPTGKDILMGITEEEGPFFVVEALQDYFGKNGHNGVDKVGKSLIRSILRTLLRLFPEVNANAVIDYYLKRNPKDLRKALSEAVGDSVITCSSIFSAEIFSRSGNDVYFYVHTRRSDVIPTAEWMGATHIHDVPYVFGLPLREGSNATQEDVELSQRVMERWTAFAKTGNPNIKGELKWPNFSEDYPVYLGIDVQESIGLSPNKDRCEIWRSAFTTDVEVLAYDAD